MKYKYIIVPKSCPNAQSIEVYEQVYNAWYELWKGVFTQGGRSFEPDTDDFLRQDYVVSIWDDKDIVGFHLYSFFDMRKKMSQRHSYFSGVNPDAFQKFEHENTHQIMSMEYLSAMPAYRKKHTSIPWGEIIIALGLKFMQSTSADAAIGTARVDVKVDTMARTLGFSEIQPPIQKYDYTCAVTVCSKDAVCPHPEPKVRSMIDELWSNRTDFRIAEEPRTLKAA